MVIDDSELDLTFLKSIINEALPFNKLISCFKDSNKALTSLKNHEYQLIVTDIEMPNLNGFDFIESIRSKPENSKTIIIAVSGSVAANNANDTILYAADKIGADYTVSKRNLYFDLNNLLKNLF